MPCAPARSRTPTSGDLVEEDLRKEVEALDLQVDQGCESDALHPQGFLRSRQGVAPRQHCSVHCSCICEELPAGVFVPLENYIEKCRIPGDLGEGYCELVVVLIREPFSLRSYELAYFGHSSGLVPQKGGERQRPLHPIPNTGIRQKPSKP